MMAGAGTSAAVRTGRTPGSSRARLASMLSRRAWACGERSTAACSIPGMRTSSTKQPAPETSRSPPSRRCDSPIICCTWGAPRWPPTPPHARRAPGDPWRASIPAPGSSRALCCRGFDVDEIEEIEQAGRAAELRQHHRGLAPVLGRVVHLVDHLLPQRVRPALTLHVRVRDHAAEVGVRQSNDEPLRVTLDRLPARADRGEVGKVAGGEVRARRTVVPALEVYPLRAHGVHEGAAERVDARAAALEQ